MLPSSSLAQSFQDRSLPFSGQGWSRAHFSRAPGCHTSRECPDWGKEGQSLREAGWFSSHESKNSSLCRGWGGGSERLPCRWGGGLQQGGKGITDLVQAQAGTGGRSLCLGPRAQAGEPQGQAGNREVGEVESRAESGTPRLDPRGLHPHQPRPRTRRDESGSHKVLKDTSLLLPRSLGVPQGGRSLLQSVVTWCSETAACTAPAAPPGGQPASSRPATPGTPWSGQGHPHLTPPGRSAMGTHLVLLPEAAHGLLLLCQGHLHPAGERTVCVYAVSEPDPQASLQLSVSGWMVGGLHSHPAPTKEQGEPLSGPAHPSPADWGTARPGGADNRICDPTADPT